MAKEKPLDPQIVKRWLEVWDQDPFCDDSVRYLQTLVPSNHCYVVITLGMGREPRSLIFRRWKHIVSWVTLPATRCEYDSFRIIASPVRPAEPNDYQFWHETENKKQRVLKWSGSDWIQCGRVVDDPVISTQGKRECKFGEALAGAHSLARWNPGASTIYYYDGSTWGSA